MLKRRKSGYSNIGFFSLYDFSGYIGSLVIVSDLGHCNVISVEPLWNELERSVLNIGLFQEGKEHLAAHFAHYFR